MNFTELLYLLLKDMRWGHPNYPKVLYWDAVQAEINKKTQQRKEKQKYYTTINRLIKYGFLIKNKKNNKEILDFTPKGLIKLQRIIWKKNKKRKLKKNEFCLVVFDIPEDKSRIRDLFRKCLYELGYSMLQKSVFISMYDVFTETQELIKNCELEKYIKIMICREIK